MLNIRDNQNQCNVKRWRINCLPHIDGIVSRLVFIFMIVCWCVFDDDSLSFLSQYSTSVHEHDKLTK